MINAYRSFLVCIYRNLRFLYSKIHFYEMIIWTFLTLYHSYLGLDQAFQYLQQLFPTKIDPLLSFSRSIVWKSFLVVWRIPKTLEIMVLTWFEIIEFRNTIYPFTECGTIPLYYIFKGAVAQWYSQRKTVLEVAGSIPAPVIVELLWLKISHNLG